MYRSPITIASLIYIVVIATLLSIQSTTAFTISMAPLLTTRLMGFGNNYAKNFSTSATAPSIDKETRWSDETIAMKKKAAVVEPRSAFQFESFDLEDVRVISHEKSDIMELIYARSINRIEEFGLASPSA